MNESVVRIQLRRLALLTATFSLCAGVAPAVEIAEVSSEELGDGSIIEYESSFCEVVKGDTVTVELTAAADQPVEDPEAETVLVNGVELKNRARKGKNAVTPNRGRGRKKGATQGATIDFSALPTRMVDVTLVEIGEPGDEDDGDWHTVHVRLLLDNGDRLGVNLHGTPCEDLDDPGALE